MVGEVDKQATLEGTADPDHHMKIHQEDKKNIEKNTEKIEEKEATQTMIEDTEERSYSGDRRNQQYYGSNRSGT